jgi:hypothetical protein
MSTPPPPPTENFGGILLFRCYILRDALIYQKKLFAIDELPRPEGRGIRFFFEKAVVG